MRQFTGGHLKHWHYFHHTFYASDYLPYIYFGKDTVWDERNPWRYLKTQNSYPSTPLERPDVLFVEGVSDWPIVLKTYPLLNRCQYGQIPVINLIQHVRHADPNNPRYEFLTQRAIRICVSSAVQSALEATQRINGPLLTIPCAIEPANLPSPCLDKSSEVCIAALKNPELGVYLKAALEQRGSRVRLLCDRIPRSTFLEAINQAKVCIFLPWKQEGFYLPALEAMALNTLVICPDCVANRSFCQDQENCFRPAYGKTEILSAFEQARALSAEATQKILHNGQQTVAQHHLRTERAAFLELLNNVEQLW